MIIDTHTHFYDPTRPAGVPWPSSDDPFLYRRIMPDDYKKVAIPEGVTGTIVVEASAWLEDHQWILDMADEDPFIIGLVGHLEPAWPEFEVALDRFGAHPCFYGIRLGRAPMVLQPICTSSGCSASEAPVLNQITVRCEMDNSSAICCVLSPCSVISATFPRSSSMLSAMLIEAICGSISYQITGQSP